MATRPSQQDVRDEMCQVIEELYRSSLITATGGNVSVRLPDSPREAWITPRGMFKGHLQPQIMVRIDLEGQALNASCGAPSSETPIHAALLRARPDVAAVIHCHAPHATILVNADLPFLPISTEAAFLADIGRIPFVMPGTPALAEAVVAALGQGWAVLMQNHGLIAVGRSLRRAADVAHIVERTAQVIWGCHAVGRKPPVLSDEIVQILRQKGDLTA
jgi:autoinducer 2 (AI-2) kinase